MLLLWIINLFLLNTMIKKTILLSWLSLLFSFYCFAQDTSAYQIQRLKINGLLAERSAKFGQYEESLNARTGIFGFQTKNDIRNSNEILRQIAINDNNIFQELKVLLDYKDVQMQQVQTTANTTSERILNYRKSIKTLQDQNEALGKQLKKAESSKGIAYLMMGIALLGCGVFGFLWKQKDVKRYEEANL